MGEIVLLIARILILVASIMCLFWPIKVIRFIYLLPKSIFTSSRLGNFIEPKTRKALELIDGDPDLYEDQFHAQMIILKISGIILMIMFIFSLCMVAPTP